MRFNRERVKSKSRVRGTFKQGGKVCPQPPLADGKQSYSAADVRRYLAATRGLEFVGRHLAGSTVIGFHEAPGIGSLRYE